MVAVFAVATSPTISTGRPTWNLMKVPMTNQLCFNSSLPQVEVPPEPKSDRIYESVGCNLADTYVAQQI